MRLGELDFILLLFASKEAQKWGFERRRGVRQSVTKIPQELLGWAEPT